MATHNIAHAPWKEYDFLGDLGWNFYADFTLQPFLSLVQGPQPYRHLPVAGAGSQKQSVGKDAEVYLDVVRGFVRGVIVPFLQIPFRARLYDA
jgi:hypothetical protein